MHRKRSVIALSLLLTAAMLLQSQIAAHHRRQEQSSFGTEEDPGEPAVTRPLPVPDAVMQTLMLDDNVKGCLSYNPLAPGQFLNSWFIASEIHLGGPSEIDLVIIPIPRAHEPDYGCFHSVEGVGWFWVYRKIGDRYRLVLRAAGNGLDILKTRTNGYRNIQARSIGMAGRYVTTVTFCFDGKLYRKCRERTLSEPEDGWPTK
jgi:hypothetical protein